MAAKKPAKKSKAAPKGEKKPAKKSPKGGGRAKISIAKKKTEGVGLNAKHQVPGGVLVGRVEDYFSHVGVIALTLEAPLSIGDMIRVKGHTTDITQKVESMQINHQSVQTASTKDAIGIHIADKARKGDAVYKI